MSTLNKIPPKEVIETLRPFISYKDDELYIENVSAMNIIERYGTPTFVFSKNRIKDNVRVFTDTFRKACSKVEFFYPYRANYLPEILNIVHSEGWGSEVVSPFEYKIAKSVSSPKIILNGFNRKLYPEIIDDKKIFYIAIDSLEDAKVINELGKAMNKTINIGLRVHPKLDTLQNKSLIPLGFKLGYDIENGDAEEIVSKLCKMKYINLVALNTHVANRESSPDLHTKALHSLLSFADNVCTKYDINIQYINIGGGFESRNLLEQHSDLKFFADKFSEEFARAKKEYTLILEPGRFIVCDTAVVLTEIISKKVNRGRRWIIVDCGINTLIPLRSASFDVIPVLLNSERDVKFEVFNVGDFIATSMGIIKEKVVLPVNIKCGDILGIINTGAYTLSMSEQFGLLRPTTILVNRDKIKVIKERENPENVVKKLKSKEW